MNLYTIGEENFEVEFKKDAFFVNGKEAAGGLSFEQLPGDGLIVKLGDSVLPAFVHREGEVFYCWVAGETYRICGIDQDAGPDASAHHEAGEKALIAPMPGKVVKVLVKAGEEVKRGTKLMIIESMKMETEIAAPADGVVSAVKYGEGEVFKEGEVLVEIDQKK
ncbi:MAG: acetyl-CoA carboxylase biotin carboxyl carrier protein subunit [Elusimicrobiales bacterium]|nr:acetyl-CoA carboxylase biotin carboxyl carrier protein subunit [Elusimicrobiales bacterium]